MNQLIYPKKEILQCDWIPPELQLYMISNSVAVNRLSTPFDVHKLVILLTRFQFRVKQIVVAYEVPPGFTRSWQYFTEEWYSLSPWVADTNDIYSPWLYGLSRDHDGSIKIILFMRQDIFRILREKEKKHIKWAYHQFQKIRSLLPEWEWKQLDPLALVGVLPGKILEWGTQWLWSEYQELVDMAERTNENSARFVVEATRRVLREYHFRESQLIILWSHWVLGKVVSKSFEGGAYTHDLKDKNRRDPSELLKNSSVILDCTNWASLKEYFDCWYFQVWKCYVWIVESYPVPDRKTVDAITHAWIDIHVLHIRWVWIGNTHRWGNMIPFPVYDRVMPCCTWSSDQDARDVIVDDLYPETLLGIS